MPKRKAGRFSDSCRTPAYLNAYFKHWLWSVAEGNQLSSFNTKSSTATVAEKQHFSQSNDSRFRACRKAGRKMMENEYHFQESLWSSCPCALRRRPVKLFSTWMVLQGDFKVAYDIWWPFGDHASQRYRNNIVQICADAQEFGSYVLTYKYMYIHMRIESHSLYVHIHAYIMHAHNFV